jgi:hypothetical protein
MNGQLESIPGDLKERFRLRFQSGLREYLARNAAAADAFASVWEQTLQQVRLQEADQARIFWELVQWARSYDLYTCAELRQTTALASREPCTKGALRGASADGFSG